MKRRALILSGLGGAAALVVGWGAMPPRSRLGGVDTMPVVDGEIGLNGWIKVVADDGHVVLAIARSEMGQGVHTALAMLVAEELDVSLAKVRLVQAGPDKLYGNVAMFVGSLPFHPSESEVGLRFARCESGRTTSGPISASFMPEPSVLRTVRFSMLATVASNFSPSASAGAP